ncbi:hypothetical protein Bbelb_073040 [Branchiostoma belcheri]|nr:hypothetical protein Bbelb_073040 [Branchiostoma belcheri]
MLDELQWASLQGRRRTTRLAMMHKIQHDLACVRCDALKPVSGSRRSRRGHSQQLQHITCRTNYKHYSFFPRTIRDWNALPTDTVQSPSLAKFVSRVSSPAKT